MEKLHDKKSSLQAKIVKKIHAAKGHGIVEGATGIGKTKIAIDYITSLETPARVLWVVPTAGLRDVTILEEWKKWGKEDYFNSYVTTICYKSLHKEEGPYDLIVLDEGHYITERAVTGNIFKNHNYGSILMLTATVPREKEKINIIKQLGLRIIALVSVNEASKMGIVAPYEVHCIPVYMDTEKNLPIELKSSGKKYITSEAQRYSSLERAISKFPRGKAPKPLYLARMHSIYRFKSKLRAAQKILSKLPEGTRTLIFCGSIDNANAICPHVYHSKTSTEDYKRFNDKEIDRLAVVNALNEGHNMTDVDSAVIMQVNSKKRNYIQRQGRAIRWRPGHKAKIYILYSHDTVDLRWVKASLEDVDPSRVKYYNPIKV